MDTREFVLAIIAIATFGGIMKAWLSSRHGPPEHLLQLSKRHTAGETEEVARLKAENARLTDRLEASEDRLAVLERIVTDKSYNLAHEIEALREDKGKVQ